MPRLSNAALLEQTKEDIRKLEKRVGNDRWAMSGAGARANPPSKAKKRVLKARIEANEATLRELRSKRDELAGRTRELVH